MTSDYKPLIDASDGEKFIKDAYVNEYLKDFNEVQAAHRIGIEESKIKAFVNAMVNDQYVRNLIREKMRTMDESTIVTRSEILNHLKHIAFTTPSEDMRFKTWSKLAKLMGMETIHVKTETVDKSRLPEVNKEMTTEDLAAIYNDEILNG